MPANQMIGSIGIPVLASVQNFNSVAYIRRSIRLGIALHIMTISMYNDMSLLLGMFVCVHSMHLRRIMYAIARGDYCIQ